MISNLESARKSTIIMNEGIWIEYFEIFQVGTVSYDGSMTVARIVRLVNRIRIY